MGGGNLPGASCPKSLAAVRFRQAVEHLLELEDGLGDQKPDIPCLETVQSGVVPWLVIPSTAGGARAATVVGSEGAGRSRRAGYLVAFHGGEEGSDGCTGLVHIPNAGDLWSRARRDLQLPQLGLRRRHRRPIHLEGRTRTAESPSRRSDRRSTTRAWAGSAQNGTPQSRRAPAGTKPGMASGGDGFGFDGERRRGIVPDGGDRRRVDRERCAVGAPGKGLLPFLSAQYNIQIAKRHTQSNQIPRVVKKKSNSAV